MKTKQGLRFFHILEVSLGDRAVYWAVASPRALATRCLREPYVQEARRMLHADP